MPPRLHVDLALAAGTGVALPADAVRHVHVLRLQPGAAITLFDGRGGQWPARIEAMSARGVRAQVLEHEAVERELPLHVTLALAMPAGDRMDVVVEKATELGVAAIVPLVSERSVLRLAGARADKRRAHWQAVAVAACEQCGRNRVPALQAPQPLATWLGALAAPSAGQARWLLGWRDAQRWPGAIGRASIITLSGPEGGLSEDEEALAAARGFVTVGLGERILRADTAPLAVMAALSLSGRAP
jgi:16S rRNA (uracil1498-N3)-methyltransferase